MAIKIGKIDNKETVVEAATDSVVVASSSDQLKQKIVEFYAHDVLSKEETKKADALKGEIKDTMTKNKQVELVFDGYKASCTVQNRESVNQEKLLASLKEIGAKHLIKTIEVIDAEALESALYNKEIDGSIVTKATESKEVIVLKVSKAKDKKAKGGKK